MIEVEHTSDRLASGVQDTSPPRVWSRIDARARLSSQAAAPIANVASRELYLRTDSTVKTLIG